MYYLVIMDIEMCVQKVRGSAECMLLDAGTAKSKLTNFSGSGDFYIACTMWAVLGETPRLDMRFILDFLNIL